MTGCPERAQKERPVRLSVRLLEHEVEVAHRLVVVDAKGKIGHVGVTG